MGTLWAPDIASDDTLADDDTLIPLDLGPADDWSDDEAPPAEGITAFEALADPFATVASAKPVPYEAPNVDLDQCVIGGRKLHVDVISAVLDAEIERTIDGASTFTLTLADQNGNIRRSELLTRDVDCTIDGFHYRLANVRKEGTQLILTFESLGIALLRQKTGFKRAWRRTHRGGKGLTRAEFVLSLVREIKDHHFPHGRIAVTIPDLHEVRPVGKFAHAPKRRDTARAQGVSSAVKIKGHRANAAQLHNLEIAMDVADKRNASKKATLAMLCSGIGESSWLDVMNGNQASVEQYKKTGQGRGSGYGGVLQGNVAVNFRIGPFWNMSPDKRTREECYSFLEGGRGYQGGGAKKLARDHSDWNPGQIAVAVEGSGAGGQFYQVHIREAEAIYKDWGSGQPGSTVTYTRIRKYAFERERGEDSWTAIQRLAQEDSGAVNSAGVALPLGFRAFFVGNRFYYISEQDLLKSRSRMTISEDSDGIDTIDSEYDRGHPIAELTVTCRARVWTAPPGTVVTIANMDIRTDGKWLVNSIGRHRGDLNTTITLRKPQAEEPEPAPQTEQSSETIPGATSSKRAVARGVMRTDSPGRIDQGVDFTGRGNVGALADGTIVRAASSGTGWPGGTMIVQKLDSPVRMHGRTYRYIYYAENIAVKVRRGQRVSAGDTIGVARGTWPFIEVGWANDAMGTTYARAHGEADFHPNHANTPAGTHFYEWLGYTTAKGYSPGGGPFGTGHTQS